MLERIFDVFTRRNRARSESHAEVPATTRKRILLWCSDVFSNSRSSYGHGDYTASFWEEIHRFLQFRHGEFQLSSPQHLEWSRADDARSFLLVCPGEAFIDFLEYIFRVDCLFHVGNEDDELVDEVNELLRVDDLPYHVTHFVRQVVREMVNMPPVAREQNVIKTLEYPRVILRQNEVTHTQVISPALELLRAPQFANANSEFLGALEDYRKSDYDDALTKAGSALESVIKVISQERGWSHDPRATASQLVKSFVSHTSLDTYFEPLLMIVFTLRNRLSSSHGAGADRRVASPHLVQYALNTTASVMLLLADESAKN